MFCLVRRIAKLKAENAKLKAENAKLKAENAKLKAENTSKPIQKLKMPDVAWVHDWD